MGLIRPQGPCNVTRMRLLGIDIGGTKTSACVGTEAGELLASRRIATTPEHGPAAWRPRMLDLAREVLAEARLVPAEIDAIGMASPGPMSVARGMMLAPPNMLGWVDVPVQAWVEEAFRRPTYINNDANACALAEWLYGNCAGAANLVYLTMSTGIGGGVIANGRLVQGVADMGGEVGHFVLDIHGPPCPCGQRGCFEIYCGGMNVANRLRERIVREQVDTEILRAAGGNPAAIDFRALVTAVRRGDRFAMEAFDEYLERLAQGFGILLMSFNPEALILGTIAIHAGDLILEPVRERLPRYAWRHVTESCLILPSALEGRIGDLSAIAVAVCGVRGTP